MIVALIDGLNYIENHGMYIFQFVKLYEQTY